MRAPTGVAKRTPVVSIHCMSDQVSSDYARIERAIRFLDAHWREQPSLAAVAAHVGLSESHFQRMFTRWAGISPKRFLQHATAQFARTLLREHRAVLPTAYAAGLSNASRLHDLMVHTEAMTPGQVSRGGDGVEIAWGLHESPLGTAFVAVTPLGICSLQFADTAAAQRAATTRLQHEWPAAGLVRSESRTRRAARAALASLGDHSGSLALHVRGTNFQLKVWTALLQIAPGAVATYGDIAGFIGAPRAVRAVGTAVGRNPVSLLIPCHRVIRAGGAIGDYAWGSMRKEIMLRAEAARVDGRR